MGNLFGGANSVPEELVADLEIICAAICECNASAPRGAVDQELKQQCVSKKLQDRDDAAGNRSTIKPEINYNMQTTPPSPIMSGGNPLTGTSWLPAHTKDIPGFKPGTGMVRRPDAVIVRNGNLPPTQDNLAAVVEIKFPPDARDPDQLAAYQEIAGPDKPLVELSPQACGCPEPEEEPERVRAPDTTSDLEKALLLLALLGLVLDDLVGGEADDLAIPVVLARLGWIL